MAKKIIGARSDQNGVTVAVQFEGNKSETPVDVAIRMASRGQVHNAHVSHTAAGKPYLRTNPDGESGNNIDTLCGDD